MNQEIEGNKDDVNYSDSSYYDDWPLHYYNWMKGIQVILYYYDGRYNFLASDLELLPSAMHEIVLCGCAKQYSKIHEPVSELKLNQASYQ
jgi:hypothetical protein